MLDADDDRPRTLPAGRRGAAAVAELFGDAVLAADGGVDRPRLSEVVADPEARRRLEAAIHPLVPSASGR